MATQPILSERRQHSRDDILGRVENIAYLFCISTVSPLLEIR